MNNRAQRFVKLFFVTDSNADLILAQHAAFSKQIPLLYITLIVNTWGLAYSFMASAPSTLTVYVPVALTFLCGGRIAVWWFATDRRPEPVSALNSLRRTNTISGFLAFVFAGWGLSLYPYGDAFAQGHVVFYMGVTVVGCVFCLMHLRSAAIRVMVTVNSMFIAFFATSGNPVFVAISLNILLVSVVMMTVLWVSYTGFVDLILSRRALKAQQDETHALSEENYRLANLDSLTGLANRRRFLQELENGRRFEAGETLSAVGVIDLDGFKAVNDSYGHTAGDHLLQVVASRLADLRSENLTVARLGGDEFGVIVRNVGSTDELIALGEDICSKISETVVIPDGVLLPSTSIGFAVVTASDLCMQDAFENADYALYDAKQNGKGHAVLFTPEHGAAIRRAAKIERALDHPDFETELYVLFQPIVDIGSGKVVAFEALARWTNKILGPISPGTFIPAAERSGMIGRLTAMLLAKSLHAARQWPSDIRLSFNLSAHDITSPEGMARLIAVIARSGIDPSQLDFEITETAALTDMEQARHSIKTLKALGASISLDDFGTGYSSLSQIHQLAWDTIKIDQSFVTDIGTNPMGFKIVKSVIALSRDMDIDCIVEGVETRETLDVLISLGCQLAQGYYFSKPMPAEAIADFVNRPTLAA